MALQCVEGGCAEGGEKVFARAYSDMMMSSGFKLKEGRFRLGIRKKFFTVRAVRHWHSCPDSGCPIPGGIQSQVGWGPGQPQLVGSGPAHGRGLGLGGICGPFQLKPFYIMFLYRWGSVW